MYMITDYQKIRDGIENAIQAGKRNFIIYPFGEYGMLTKQILMVALELRNAILLIINFQSLILI